MPTVHDPDGNPVPQLTDEERRALWGRVGSPVIHRNSKGVVSEIRAPEDDG